MSNLIMLDETLSFLNGNEESIFDSLMESINVELLSEKVDFKAIGQKLKNLIDTLIVKIKEFIGKIKNKIVKCKSKEIKEKFTEKMKEKDDENSDTETETYSYLEVVYEYNGKEFREKDFDKLISTMIEAMGDNHLFNVFHAACYESIDKAREGFENFKSYDKHQNFTTDIKMSTERHTGLSLSQFEKYYDGMSSVFDKTAKESTWALNALDRLKKDLEHIENTDDPDKSERYTIASYMIKRVADYYNIIAKISNLGM